MILKISTESGWRFIDNVEDVFIHQDSADNIAAQGNDCPTEWMDFDKHLPVDMERDYKVLKLKKNDSLCNRIVIKNNTVYLLNDEGKTIERIN